ncbi:MAG: class I SAM-dependent methyltransferase [Fusobacteria bacterium]|nr:class I SAM-dependent methyltransferase [Fusobacteriota bacterium]
MNRSKCPLCGQNSKLFFIKNSLNYYKCENCYGIYLDKSNHLSPLEEKSRYEKHNNDVSDNGYRKFVSPITDNILMKQNTKQIGLDFGSGKNSATSAVLKEYGYNINLYDPFFNKNSAFLNLKYNYIICCEVMEHFFNPATEFNLLYSLLCEDGRLYCMTDIYKESTNFSSWYYKEDLTHVFFYQDKTLYWIKEQYNYKNVFIDKRLIIFEK